MNEIGALARNVALAGVIGLALAGPAFAHAHLTGATPPAQATAATAPTQLTLTFSEGVNLAFTGATVAGPDGKAVVTGKAALKASDDRTLVVPLAATLVPGTYTVEWHALSKDGHKTKGSYRFTVAAK